MVDQYADSVFRLVRETPNTRDGMTKIVQAGEAAVTDIDGDITDLLTQRKSMVTIVQQYAQLYELLQEEALRSEEHLEDIEQIPTGASEQDTARALVMRFARNGSQGDGIVTDDYITGEMRDHLTRIPWRNPKAVIATILTRSGQFARLEPGKYQRIDER